MTEYHNGARPRQHKTADEIAKLLALQADCEVEKSKRLLIALAAIIRVNLKRGQPTTLTNFGTFYVGKRKARTGRNPRTGATIIIAAAKLPKFRAHAALKNVI